MYATKIVALIAALSAPAFAFDVYSEFYDNSGAKIGSTNFDVSNGGCFTVNGAIKVTFTQHDTTGQANGPYCLTSYTAGGCGTKQGTQQFGPVDTDGATQYTLNSGIANADSFSWSAAACP